MEHHPCIQRALQMNSFLRALLCMCVTGQGALAYVTAATHDLEEDAARIEESLAPELVAELRGGLQPDARLLLPPHPILKEDNWPLLTVSKGFFESLAAGGARPLPCCLYSFPMTPPFNPLDPNAVCLCLGIVLHDVPP